MKAMVIKAYGEDAAFEAMDIDKPKVKDGHVLVRISASSVNTVDTMIPRPWSCVPDCLSLSSVLRDG